MKKNASTSTSANSLKDSKLYSGFNLFVDIAPEIDNTFITKTIQSIKSNKISSGNVLLLVSNDLETQIAQKISNEIGGKDNLSIEILSHNVKRQSIVNQLLTSDKSAVLLLNTKSINSSVDLDAILSASNADKEIVSYYFEQKVNDNLILFKNDIALKLFSQLPKHEDYIKSLMYLIDNAQYKFDRIQLKGKYPFGKNKCSFNPLTPICSKWNWFVKTPINDIKANGFDFSTSSSLYRLMFAVLAFSLFIIMPLMSLDAGISGDEPKWQYPQGVRVYNFYKSWGQDTSYMNVESEFYTYGVSFDTMAAFWIDVLDVDDVYTLRHMLNAIFGWLIILFVGLFASRLAGWRAGILAMLLLYFSPRFLGHAFNNPKDIPFATGYMMAIYFIYKLFKEYPKVKLATALGVAVGLGLTLSVRSGGLILFPMFGLFGVMFYLTLLKQDKGFGNLIRILKYGIIISIIGYILGIILWPYALKSPIGNVLESLKLMTNFSVSLRQIFDNKVIWSDKVPWYYIPKYMLITVPMVVMAGVVAFVIFFRKLKYSLKYISTFILVFAFAFPIAYIIYKNSNLYGGWRHVIFCYPPLIVMAGVGIDAVLKQLKSIRAKIIVSIIIIALSADAIYQVIANHPHQYVYYNPLIGGNKGALGKYEMDYYFHSLKAGAEWLKENKLKDKKSDKKIIITTNSLEILTHYFRKDTAQVELRYSRYYERGNDDWDYAIFANVYINSWQLRKGIFPPKNTIHTIDVNGVAVSAILERKDRNDFVGNQLLEQGKMIEAIPYLQKAIEADSANEAALLNLSRIYSDMNMFNEAINTLNQCLKIYPNYDQALNILGITYLRKGDFNNAVVYLNQLIKVNFKYYMGYQNLAIAYLQLNRPYDAIRVTQSGLQVNGGYKPFYQIMAEALNQIGKTEEAKQYLQAASSL